MSARLIKIGAVGGGGLGVSGLAVFLVLYFESRNDKPRPAAREKYENQTVGEYKNQTVATDTQECSEIGNKILAKDGSAVDAAIAAMFCLGVINMHSSGIGGGGVMLVYNRSAKAASIIDFRETAPLIVSNFTPNATGVNESRFGGLAIAVPGEVKGMYQASQKYGRLPWKELVEPYYP